ncbi:MAG TPA: glycosyltransferase family 1 protein, partial [Herpetosiphonaceae bacterium]
MSRPLAIDARLHAYRQGGIVLYTARLVAALAALAPEEDWLVLEHRKAREPLVAAPNVRRARLWTPPHHRWEQLALPLELALRRPRLIHSPDFIPPLRRTCPAVITVHDLAFIRYPEILDDAAKRFYGQIGAAVRSADAIIAVSRSTAADLTELLGVPPERIDVIHSATDLAPLPVAPGDRREIGGVSWAADSFLAFVSTIEPRKNIPTLLRALRLMIDREPRAGYRLALAGRRGWLDEPVWALRRELGLEEAALLVEGPSDDEVRWLLSACKIYVNPSWYEGFGLPLLEALACGAPSVAADSSSLPEVAGDAALLVPPGDA